MLALNRHVGVIGHPKDRDKAQRKFFEDRTEKLAAKVKITEKAMERLDREKVDKPSEPWQLGLSFGGGRRSGDLVARLDGAVVRRGSFTLGPVDLQLAWQDRVAVVGPNGGGKSTLLAALLSPPTTSTCSHRAAGAGPRRL